MNRKITFPLVVLFLISLSCKSLSQTPTADNVLSTPTQETITQQTMTQSSAYILPEYLYLSDAYKITKNEDGSIEFYTNLSFDEIGEYYLNELPLHGYSQIHPGGPRAVEGCYQIFFKGDPGGKTLIIMPCIVFQTEEHWVSISLEDN